MWVNWIDMSGVETRSRSARLIKQPLSRGELHDEKIIKPALQHLKRWHWEKVRALNLGGDSLSHQYLLQQGVKAEAIEVPKADFLRYIASPRFKLDYEPQTFDVVVANMVLHKLSERRLRQTVGDISETMNSGGQLFFIGPNPKGDTRLDLYLSEKKRLWLNYRERYNPHYIDVIRSIAPELGFSYVEIPKLMTPKATPYLRAEVEYEPWHATPIRTAGLLVSLQNIAGANSPAAQTPEIAETADFRPRLAA